MQEVEMKQFEIWCEQYAKAWNHKDRWDYYILVKDAWLDGFKKCRAECGTPALGEEKQVVQVSSNQIGG